MAKLRAIKERKESNEVVHNDLRGLGESGLFIDGAPMPFINIASKTGDQSIHKICSMFNLEQVSEFGPYKGDILISKNLKQNPKAQLLELYAASLVLLNEGVSTSVSTWSQFHSQMTNLLESKVSYVSTPFKENHATFDEWSKIVLEQNGIHLKSDAEVSYVSKSDAKQKLSEFSKVKQTEVKSTKVG